MNQHHRVVLAVMTVCLAWSSAACGGTVPPAAVPTVATTATPAAMTSAPGTSAPTPAGVAFQTRFLAPSLDLAVPTWVKATPEEEAAHFLTFFSADGGRAIRILSPQAVYPPGATQAAAVPADYVTYFDGTAAKGVELTDRVETTVDGHATVVETAFSPQTFDGSIGCQAADLPAANCFGVGDEVIVRVAMIKTDAGPLLMWLRLKAADHPDMTAAAADFVAFLAGVKFADRAALPEPAAAEPRYDGTYTWTITRADGAADPGSAGNDPASYPWVFTMDMHDGVVKIKVTFAAGDPQEGTGSYEAADGKLTLHFGGIAQVYAVEQEADGSLQLTAIDVKDPGDVFVNTVHPWTKVP